MLVGHLHYRANPEHARCVYAYAAVAKAEGINYMYFTPRRVNLDTNTIKGLFYENGKWVERNSTLPNAIINEATRTDKYSHVVRSLEERIPFTSHSIGSKLSVYERLNTKREFRENLIPTKEIENLRKDLSDFINKYDKVVVKPLMGAKGDGVIAIEHVGDDAYNIIASDQTIKGTLDDVFQFIRDTYQDEPVLVQKYITCVTKSGQPYDFRLHVQRDGTGRWVITSVYYRIASFGKFISNLSSGGSTGSLDIFLRQQFGDSAYNMRRYLEQFGLKLAACLDEVYGESFDELGIDVGVDEIRKAWIYEVNWKPGCPPNLFLELDVARNAIRYAEYLAKQQDRNRTAVGGLI